MNFPLAFALLSLVVAPLFLSGQAVGAHLATAPSSATPSKQMDTLIFGAAASEAAHGLNALQSDVVVGGLKEATRRLLPAADKSWEGGRVAFTLAVDPARLNYFTARFWGGEGSENRLILFCEGKQVGYRHAGDIDLLDFGNEKGAAPFLGRFFYKTFPLPIALTRGKTALSCEIRSSGRIWPYGTTFEQYQHPMEAPSRGLYRVYSHLDGFFGPPNSEKQGALPTQSTLRLQNTLNKPSEAGPEVLEALKARVSREIGKQLSIETPSNQPLMLLLARAYFVKWTPAYQNPKVIAQATKFLDTIFLAFRKNPKLAQADPQTYNPDWFGLGPSGYVIALLADGLKSHLDDAIDDGAGGQIKRRAAYAEMLIASRDWHRENRRQYTNQSMINDLYGIYLCNRGVGVVDAARALPASQTLGYLYQSLGLRPWLGSEKAGVPQKPLGDNYWQLTDKGLTKELGYVGFYGEVLDWVVQVYDATRPAPDLPGDAKIRAQLIQIARARAAFRYPALDDEGHSAMRVETIVGWRDEHYPGDVVYAQRPSWDGSSTQVAAVTLDPALVGAAQQMFEENQFFSSLCEQMKEGGFRTTIGLLDTPDQYELLRAQPRSAGHLPMASGQPDFVFFDAEDGVVALKHDAETLYVSLYWRARFGINNLARVHYITPQIDRIATVQEASEWTPSGQTFARTDSINTDFAPWLPNYPGEIHSAHAGEALPIAKIPAGVEFKVGRESPYAGKAEFYRLRYGPYLIAMNTTTDKTFSLPALPKSARELVTKKTFESDKPVSVGPRSAAIFYLNS